MATRLAIFVASERFAPDRLLADIARQAERMVLVLFDGDGQRGRLDTLRALAAHGHLNDKERNTQLFRSIELLLVLFGMFVVVEFL